jgi:hypothetical protein
MVYHPVSNTHRLPTNHVLNGLLFLTKKAGSLCLGQVGRSATYFGSAAGVPKRPSHWNSHGIDQPFMDSWVLENINSFWDINQP